MTDCSPGCDLNSTPSGDAGSDASPALLPVETWLGSGTVVLEADGRVVAAYDAMAAWLGSSPATLKGQSLAKLLGQRQPKWERALEDFIVRTEGFDRLELSGT